MQLPRVHFVLPGQTLPQVLQLLLSNSTSMHLPPQSSEPKGQAPESTVDPASGGGGGGGFAQLPFVQVCPAPHLIPQAPQLLPSPLSATQTPLQGSRRASQVPSLLGASPRPPRAPEPLPTVTSLAQATRVPSVKSAAMAPPKIEFVFM